MRTIGTVAALGAALLSGCAQPGLVVGPPEQPAVDEHLVPDSYEGRFQTVGTVLESPEHGPQLCYFIATSYPPQCGGPDIAGWDWAALEAESARDTTWGTYRITGTWDGRTFTLTEPAVADTGSSYPNEEYDFSAPCPEPTGGWEPFPAELAADPPAYEAATAAIQELPGLGGTWVDQGGTADDPTPLPGRYVLVVRTAGDVSSMETAAREVWPGALCVVGGARYTDVERRAIQDELGSAPGALGAAVDVVDDDVTLTVYVAAVARQRDLDERYGVGVVRQLGVLEPLD